MPKYRRFFDRWRRPLATLLTIVLASTSFNPGLIADELRVGEPNTPDAVTSPEVNSRSSAGEERILLPDIGAAAGGVLTPTEERRIGAQFMSSVRQSLPVIDDPLLSDYIQKLGHRLVEASDMPNAHFTFFLIDEPVVNAFAGPGGYIGVYTGLILETRSESELASVMAHEIAHVTQRHLYRAFEQANRLSGPAAILMLGAVLLGAAAGGDAGIAAAAGVQAGMAQNQINFTRSNEKEADRVGIKTLAHTGYDPRAMPDFFGRLAKASRMYETSAPEFLRTHPVTTNRIADARGRAEQYPRRPSKPSLDYHLVKATLRFRRLGTPEKAIAFFRQPLKDGSAIEKQARRYGYALALIANHDLGQARKQVERLLQEEPDQITYLITSARLDLQTGKSKRALRTLQAALELYPGNYPLTMAYGASLLDSGNAAKAKTVLLRAVKSRTDNANLYMLLAKAAGEAGDIAEAHQYQAEYYHLRNQIEPAIQQLQIALRDKNLSFYQASRMEARLNEFKAERKAMKADR